MFLVFDFDGTLADTRVPFQDAFNEAARTLDVQTYRKDDDAYLRTLEASEVLHAHGIDPDQFTHFTGLLKQGMESRRAQICLIAGVADALHALGKLGRPLGLITSNSETLVRSVLAEHVVLFRYLRFDVSIKEKGAVLTQAASECSALGPLHYVGDEIRDFRAAIAANVSFSAVTWGFNTEAALREEGCDTFVRLPIELTCLELQVPLHKLETR